MPARAPASLVEDPGRPRRARVVAALREAALAHLVEHALVLAPQDPELHAAMGLLQSRAGDEQSCVLALRRSLELNPQHLPAVSALERLYPRLLRVALRARVAVLPSTFFGAAKERDVLWYFKKDIAKKRLFKASAGKAATVRAVEEDLVKLPAFKEAAQAVADFEIDLQIDEIEDHYYHGADARPLEDGMEGN